MSQEETRENIERNENSETKATDAGEIDNLPIESIGSYARVDELLTDEEKENTTREGAEG
jgi:hypothetical protein